jgi:hypothetical protein
MSLSQASGLTNKQMEKLQEEYAKIQLQRAVAAQQQSAYNAAQQQTAYTTNNAGNLTLGGALTANTASWWSQAPIPIEVPQHNLNEGAWDVAISQLVDLWVVKYGSAWVNESELDEFYLIAAKRLRVLHKLEQHYVNGTDVYRIVE